MSYRTHRSSGYGYGSLTELPEVPSIVTRTYRTYRSSGCGYDCPTELTEVPGTRNTRLNAHPVGEGVRFEVEDFIQIAWHVLTEPTSRRQSVVALRAISIIDKTTTERGMNLNEWRPGQQPRSRLLFCNILYHSVPRLWRLKKNNGGREPNFITSSISHVPRQRSEDTKTQRIVQDVDESCIAVTADLHFSDRK